MTQFTPTRFTHQNKDEYGQGKKVTTKILETDAENTEYLLQELQETRQKIIPPLTQTYTPLPIRTDYSENITTTTVSTQDITSNTGKTYHIRAQTLHTITTNKTTAHIESQSISVPGKITSIRAPTVTTGTATCTKSILTTPTTIEIPILGTLEEITGSSTGEVQSDSMIQEYYDKVKPTEQWTKFNTYNSFLTWMGQVNYDNTNYPFPYWLALEKQKTIYGLYQGGELPLLWAPEGIQDVLINNQTVNFTMNKASSSVTIPTLATVPSNYEGGDVLTLVGTESNILQDVTTDEINFAYEVDEVEIVETPEGGRYYHTVQGKPLPEALQVFKNGDELVQGIDYQYSLKNNNITVYDVSAGDYLEVQRSITTLPDTFVLVYDAIRNDIQSQFLVLPVQIHYQE